MAKRKAMNHFHGQHKSLCQGQEKLLSLLPGEKQKGLSKQNGTNPFSAYHKAVVHSFYSGLRRPLFLRQKCSQNGFHFLPSLLKAGFYGMITHLGALITHLGTLIPHLGALISHLDTLIPHFGTLISLKHPSHPFAHCLKASPAFQSGQCFH